MYVSDYTKSLEPLSRYQCVNIIFEVGGWEGYNHSLKALVSAVQIADIWVAHHQIYSQELAHVALVLGTKLEDDFVYKTSQAAEEAANHIVYTMEWELWDLLDHRRPTLPLFNLIELPRSYYLTETLLPTLAPVFEVLMETICLKPMLLQIHPGALLLGIKLLVRRHRLRAIRKYRARMLERLFAQLAREYEVQFNQVVTAYLKFKRISP